jgi:predicted O-methyltransferase YrrM
MTFHDHRDVMVYLARQLGWRRGVELGLGKGLLFHRLLRDCPDLHMVGVDMFKRPERHAMVDDVWARYADRATVHGCLTVEAASRVADASVDFVFIDAGHSYTAVSTDIRAWQAKVKPGGWFGGHDYSLRFPGVIQAVREAFGDRVDLLPFDIWARSS